MATFDPFMQLRYLKAAAASCLLVPELPFQLHQVRKKNVTWLANAPESTQMEQQGTKSRASL